MLDKIIIPNSWLFIGLCLVVICRLPAEAQDPSAYFITDVQGLPSMTVYNILQDQEGFMWFGTANGIARFDGVTMKTYQGQGQKDNEILSIREDDWGRIWYMNLSKQLFYIDKEEVYSINLEALGKDAKIIGFWFFDQKLVFKMNRKSESDRGNTKFGFYSFDESKIIDSCFIYSNEYSVVSDLVVREDLVFFNANGEYLALSKRKEGTPAESQRFEEVKMPKAPFLEFKDHNYHLSVPAHHYRELVKVIGKGEINLKENDIKADRLFLIKGELWGLGNEGIKFLNAQNPEIVKKESFKDIQFNTVLEDKEGNIWAATSGKGLLVIPNLLLEIWNPLVASKSSQEVDLFYIDSVNNMLVIGYRDQIVFVEKENKVKAILKNEDGVINDIFRSGDGHLIIIADRSFKILRPDLSLKTRLDFGGLKKGMVDKDGYLWLGLYGMARKTVRNFTNATSKYDIMISPQNIVDLRTYALLEDKQYQVWIGTTSGLYVYFEEQLTKIEDEQQYSNFNIAEIIQAPDSTLWVGTLGNGILQFKDQKIINTITMENGLSSNSCKNLLLVDQQLWAGTNLGINKINLENQQVEQINISDGLPSNEINDLEVFEQEIMVATPKGLAKFPTTTTFQNSFPPPVHIAKVKIWNEEVTVQDTFELKYDQNDLTINYSGIAYRAQGNLSYRYRLSGINRDWVITDQNLVRFPSLNPGKYTFELLAINEDGTPGLKPAQIYFDIAPPWWATWWARILTVLLLIAVIASFFYWRLLRIRERERLNQSFQNKITELRQEALQAQMNPHFVFNSLNAIQHFITKNEEEQALLYLSNFARLIRMIFEQSKEKEISLEEELDFLQAYLKLEKLRFKDKVEINLQIAENLKENLHEIRIPPLLIQPIVENAFKHGLFHKKGSGRLRISLKKKEDYLYCEIEDNGVGRNVAATKSIWKNKEEKSSGLKTAKERLELINGEYQKDQQSQMEILDLYNQEGIACGTLVKMNIQLKY